MLRGMNSADKRGNERMEKRDEQKPAKWMGQGPRNTTGAFDHRCCSCVIELMATPVASRQVSSLRHPKKGRRYIILRGGPKARQRGIYTNEP